MLKQYSSWEGPLPAAIVTEQIKTALFGPYAQDISYEALRAEAIRVAVWALTARKQGLHPSNVAVSTRRVLAQARVLCTPFQDINGKYLQNSATQDDEEAAGETELERDLLDALEEQGDLFSFLGGNWLPAPLRLVPMAETRYLFVGGVPTHLLPQSIMQAIRLHGSFRHITGVSDNLPIPGHSSAWQFQALENWLGPTPLSFDQLIHDFRTRELLPISSLENLGQLLEVYVASPNKPQAQRWLPFESVPDGHYLLRTQMQWGKREYTLGDIQKRCLMRQSTTLNLTDIRRLLYALDYEAHVPTRVIWEREQGRLILQSEFPVRERKLLASLGHLQVPKEGYYPRTWVGIASQYTSKVDEMLARSCVHVDTKQIDRKESLHGKPSPHRDGW